MKSLLKILPFLLFSIYGEAQDTVITISPGMLAPFHAVELGNMQGWFFRKGNDIAWSKKNIDIKGWEKLNPSELLGKPEYNSKKLEGWLRIKIKLDTAFRDTSFYLHMESWAASEMYVDGNFLATYGNTGVNGKPYKEHRPSSGNAAYFSVQKGIEHSIAIHVVDYPSVLPPYQLKSSAFGNFIYLFTIEAIDPGFKTVFFISIWFLINIMLCLLFWLLALLNRREKNLLLIALTSTCFTLYVYCSQFYPGRFVSFLFFRLSYLAQYLLAPLILILSLVLVIRIFRQKITLLLKIAFCLVFISGIINVFFENVYNLDFQVGITTLICAYYVFISWKTLKGAQWAVLTGILLMISFGLVLLMLPFLDILYSDSLYKFLSTGLYLSFPLSLLVYVSIRFKEIIKEVRENAKQVVRLSEEKKEQALNQQKILQEEVNRQTIELRTSLQNLKATQQQLIQSEKMASLGELTAGIAHEIQNPLNFVNNFSEVNTELIEELKTEIEKGNYDEVKFIANDLSENEQKINQHGKRADAIVKGMLEHSKQTTGVKEPTAFNKLVDEYLRLAYHGQRAKDKNFNVEMKTDFDGTVGKVNIVRQDMGRVLLNLFNNAFYAVNEKMKTTDGLYQPTVLVQTKKLNGQVQIIVSDNGTGISSKIVDKIFQPFFTTKPTGQGTGLGLSLAYDIITKEHSGTIKVESNPSEGSEFIVQLPIA